MKKRVVSLILAVILLVSCLAVPAFAASGLQNFRKIQTYDGRFTDITGRWFYGYIKDLYEYGMVTGKTATTFVPDANVTKAEGITMAARIHAVYHGNAVPNTNCSPWYQNALVYALENGILVHPNGDYDAPYTQAITKYELAVMLCTALPSSALPAINNVGYIPDVPYADGYFELILELYNAGVLTGADGGKFYPGNNITRAEAMTLLNRMVNPAQRQRFTMPEPELVSGTYYDRDNTMAPGNYITFNASAKTFHLYVNLFEGYGNAYGTYAVSGGEYITCTVTSRDFYGFLGDDVESLTFRYTAEDTIVLVGADPLDDPYLYPGRLLVGGLCCYAELTK